MYLNSLNSMIFLDMLWLSDYYIMRIKQISKYNFEYWH